MVIESAWSARPGPPFDVRGRIRGPQFLLGKSALLGFLWLCVGVHRLGFVSAANGAVLGGGMSKAFRTNAKQRDEMLVIIGSLRYILRYG